MTISPITMYATYYASLVKQDDEDLRAKRVREQLEALGYTSTGNVQTDIILLQKIQSQNSSSYASFETQQELPWQKVLDKLSLQSTGNREDDYRLIMNTLEERIKSVSDESDKNIILNLFKIRKMLS